MGKGERRGGGRRAGGRRAGGHRRAAGHRHRAGHRHHIGHLHHARARGHIFRSRGARRGGGGTIHIGPGTPQKTVLGICLCFFGFFMIGVGIMLTAIFASTGSGVVAVGACVLGVGFLLFLAGLWSCNRQWKDNRAAGAQAQGQPWVTVISDATGTATVTTTTVNQDGQTVIDMVTNMMTAMSNQTGGNAATDWSNMTAGQPYPGSQPYPGPAAAGGFGSAPSAPAPSGPAPPPQYGFTYNTSDNYNTQYSAGTSDLPPPPAYSTVVNEKL
ncbi:uncharacterized protein LOC144881722 isoform X7 [Branchiostoma floridae x Branchiostoma japonicum]